MASDMRPPFQAQDVHEVAEMLRNMEAMGKSRGRGGFHIRKKTYPIHYKQGMKIDSWSMLDHDYKKPNLPTYARGLFTRLNSNKQPEIAVRGYDKFFNVGEVSATQWEDIIANTRGPYELSVKENGCIIFIAGLEDDTLVVTSKHSTGPRHDASANHSLVGDNWVDKQLKAVGKTREDLARRLRQMNATAIAELCDDEFEEHVLEYTPDAAGLYLHGINLNLPQFATYPGPLIDKFAEEWGFRKTMYVMKDNIHQVKAFLEEVAETGNYDGRDTEGFVIRCQTRESAKGGWHDWFFKYKFEEPYLMYRQWRECTKAVIVGKAPKFRKHKKITEEYLLYARRQLHKDPSIGKLYNQNHGIIAMRNGFLAEKGLKGSDIIRQEIESGEHIEAGEVIKDVILLPIATLGCGKTTVALALAKLFNWGHVQNDNIEGKQRRPQRFAMAVAAELAVHPVMIADRNNHQKRERQQIIEDLQQVIPTTTFVALNYVHDRANLHFVRKATQERVLSRGDNHQTIQAGSKSQDEILGIMEGFLRRFEPIDITGPPDDAFDFVINLDPTAPSRDNLETIINALHNEFPKLFAMPSDDAMDEAIATALNEYKPTIKHDLGPTSNTASNNKHQKQDPRSKPTTKRQTPDVSLTLAKPKPKVAEYFGIFLSKKAIDEILESVFSSGSTEATRFYKELKNRRRLQAEYHVTLIHRASIAEHADAWNELHDQWERNQIEAGRGVPTNAADALDASPAKDPDVLGSARVQLERVVWDDRIMCIVARLLDGNGEQGWRTVNATAHVTVGTAGDGIKPKESNDLLKRWLDGDESGALRDARIKGQEVLQGTVRVVLRR